MRIGRVTRWVSALRMAVLALLAAGATPPAAAQDDPVSGRIGVSIAGIEWQVARKLRCDARLPPLEQRIAEAELEPEPDAELLASLYPRRDSLRRCLADAPARIATLESALDALVAQFVAVTGIARDELDARLATLHDREAAHAEVAYRLRGAQWALRRMQESVSPDPVRIAQKESVVATISAELEAAIAAVAQANADLADLEAQLAEANRTGSAALSWVTPTTRENGAPLAAGELAGYEIYVLSESTGESSVITLEDPLATAYTVDSLPPDTYHFSIAAYDLEGKFSQLSEIVSKSVP
jgi:hypothetical protein